MKSIAAIFLLAVLTINPALAGEVKVENFEAKTTRDLINLCTASPDDPHYSKAVHFCHGYLVGAFHYYEASTAGPNAHPIVCPPKERPSRNETIQKFIEWAKARPQYWNELPVETEFRFLTELWPCDN
jgi:hypothetical protein